MSETEKDINDRLFMRTQIVERSHDGVTGRSEEVALTHASSIEVVLARDAEAPPAGLRYIAAGPWIEVPLGARGMVHACMEAAFVRAEGEGEPLFIEVLVTDGGFEARPLTQQRGGVGWADLVHMAGGLSASECSTPGEALGALASGLDRVLVGEAWRANFGEPRKEARKAMRVDSDEHAPKKLATKRADADDDA